MGSKIATARSTVLILRASSTTLGHLLGCGLGVAVKEIDLRSQHVGEARSAFVDVVVATSAAEQFGPRCPAGDLERGRDGRNGVCLGYDVITMPHRRPLGPGQPWKRGGRGNHSEPRRVSDASIVRELEGDSEILVLQHRDDLLQVVAVLAGDAHLIFLDRGLHADLRVLDEAHNLLGALDRDALLERDLLAEGAAGGLLDFAVGERLQWYTALVQARLQNVDDRFELHVVGCGRGDVGILDRHAALGAFEIVAGVDLASRLVERVRHLLHVDLARDVERVFGGHSPLAYLSGPITHPLGATNVKVRSGSPLFTAIFEKRIVTVFSNWSWTTAFLISQLLG